MISRCVQADSKNYYLIGGQQVKDFAEVERLLVEKGLDPNMKHTFIL